MAVVSVTELYEGVDAEAVVGGRTYTRVFHVECDDMDDGPYVARTADDGTTSVPAVHDTHPKDTSAWVSRVRAMPLVAGDPYNFRVEVSYGTRAADGSGGGESLLEQPATISGSFYHSTEEVTVDTEGTLIANSAGDPFTGVIRHTSRPVLSIVQYEADFDFGAAAFYMDRVNSEQWQGLSPGQGKLSDASAQWMPNDEVWRVTFKIEVNWDGWNPALVDKGRRAIIPEFEDDGPIVLVDAYGNPYPIDTMLDGSGHKAEEGEPIKYMPSGTTSRTERFKIYREMDFTILAIRWPWS